MRDCEIESILCVIRSFLGKEVHVPAIFQRSGSMSMTGRNTCVAGLGWGDEGKGKIVDLLCESHDFVVRFNGGANAGHTVCVSDQKYALHLLPTGILHSHCTAVIGPGVVVDPTALIAEMGELTSRGVKIHNRLWLCERAHIVLSHHKIEDSLSEKHASETARIGTTSRGIGPCYADKMRRSTAFRVADLVHDRTATSRLERVMNERKKMFLALYGDDGGLDIPAALAEWNAWGEKLRPFIRDTTAQLREALDAGKNVLFEGANGILLDVDHGTYPFVTSSSTGPHGIGSGAGVPAASIHRVIGVLKAYSTRVGAGPFVTELKDATGDRIRKQGHEYGTTTGRPRRCGWFDAVSAQYAAELSGATDLALLHLDTLGGFDEVGLCTAYRCEGRTWTSPPSDCTRLSACEPILECVPGWTGDLRACREYDELPASAREYVERIESLVGVPVTLVGVGPDRSQTICRGGMRDLVGLSSRRSTQPAR